MFLKKPIYDKNTVFKAAELHKSWYFLNLLYNSFKKLLKIAIRGKILCQ